MPSRERLATTRPARSGPVPLAGLPGVGGAGSRMIRPATSRLARSGPLPVVAPGGVVPEATELLEALWDVLSARADLTSLIGRPAGGPAGWLWIERVPPGYRLPLVVLNDDVRGEITDWAYDGSALQDRTVRVDVFAAAHATPPVEELAGAVRAAILEGSDEIAWTDGAVLDRVPRGVDPEPIETRIGPGGRLIRGRRSRIDLTVQFSPRG